MKYLKKIFIILLLIIGVNSVEATTERTFDTTIKIYDYAQVLNEKEENDLKKSVDKYIKKHNIDMVLVTIKHYNQNTLEEYMELFYDTNKFGVGDNKSGIMFTMDFKKQDIGIKTYGLATDLYSANELSKIINKVEKKDNNKDKLSTFIKYSNKYINEYENECFDENVLIQIDWIGISIISLILSIMMVFIGILKSKNKNLNKTEDNCVKSLIITIKEDCFITTNTKKRKN
ncbi:MAG: TPM domain-containing protein [Bacilli bacterium]|nr:TPM domain-containing protein [Bacilli bacterium]